MNPKLIANGLDSNIFTFCFETEDHQIHFASRCSIGVAPLPRKIYSHWQNQPCVFNNTSVPWASLIKLDNAVFQAFKLVIIHGKRTLFALKASISFSISPQTVPRNAQAGRLRLISAQTCTTTCCLRSFYIALAANSNSQWSEWFCLTSLRQ